MGRDWIAELVEMIREANRTAANALIDEWAQGVGYERAVTELLSPALEYFGEQWAKGADEASLAQGYVASKIAEDVLAKVLALQSETFEGGAPATKGPVVVGNVEDDYHPLGRKMVTAFLRLAGWQVEDLGVDVPPEVFLEAAERLGARVIGASAMMYTTAKNVARLRAEIDRRGLRGRVQLAVGGAVFKLRPELVAEFGADGTAASALQAPALFETLWARSLQGEGMTPEGAHREQP